jgi:3-aminobutyryl-CoA ammonia-lyase
VIGQNVAISERKDTAHPDATLRVRLGTRDTHYRSQLIPAATVMRYFADCSSELGLRQSGRTGLLAAYEGAEFLKPLHVGDFIEIRATVVSRGQRSRRVNLEAWRYIYAAEWGVTDRRSEIVEPVELVARATMVSVTPRTTA